MGDMSYLLPSIFIKVEKMICNKFFYSREIQLSNGSEYDQAIVFPLKGERCPVFRHALLIEVEAKARLEKANDFRKQPAAGIRGTRASPRFDSLLALYR